MRYDISGMDLKQVGEFLLDLAMNQGVNEIEVGRYGDRPFIRPVAPKAVQMKFY